MKSGDAKSAGSTTDTNCSAETCACSAPPILTATWNRKIRVRVLDDNVMMRTGGGGIKVRAVLYERIDTPEGLTVRRYEEFRRLFRAEN